MQVYKILSFVYLLVQLRCQITTGANEKINLGEPHQHMKDPEMDVENCYSDESTHFCYDPNSPRPSGKKQENLFFLTPWNKVSFTHALNHAKTITHVSPVWFYLTKKGTNKYLFDGTQDIDFLFVKKLKAINPQIKVLPRFYVQGMMEETRWFFHEKIYKSMVNKLVNLCSEFEFDGIVFDIPMLNRLKYKGSVKKFMEHVKDEFNSRGFLKFHTFSGYRLEMSKNPAEI